MGWSLHDFAHRVRLRLGSIGLGLAAVCLANSVGAKTIVVKPNGTGDRPTIQAAVDAAHAGDVVELRNGIFAGPGNRDVDYRGKAITIRSRDGVPSACVIDCGGTSGVPHRAFLFGSGEGAGSVLQGVRLRNGYVWDEGGLVRCEASSPTLRHVEWFDSNASFGGGLACLGGALPRVENGLFTGNRADFGSGAACRGSAPTFVDCRFSGNLTAEIGGGLLCEAASHATLDRCSFDQNQAEIGGGLACRDGSDPRLFQCQFTQNLAEAGGAEGGGAWCANSSPTFTECTFVSNVALGHGGALVCVFASPLLVRCTLYGNRSPLGGGIYSWLDSAPVVVSTILAASPEGEAVACESGGAATLSCSDLYGNAGGDWVGSIATQLANSSNFCRDPRFCDATAGAFQLRSDSPCLAGAQPNHDDCGVVGAFGSACAATASADLALRKVADRPAVPIGGLVTFTITLRNLGPAVARGIVFGDPVPDALNFVSFACSRGSITGASYCAVDSIAPGDSVTATLVATPISNPAPNERWCENTAYIAVSATADPNSDNDHASALVHILDVPSGVETNPESIHDLALWSAVAARLGDVRLAFSLPAAETAADLSLFDVRGRRVAVLAHGPFAAGRHVVEWKRDFDAALTSGVYLARLDTSRGSVSSKVLLIR